MLSGDFGNVFGCAKGHFQTFTLPNGIEGETFVLPNLLASGIDKITRMALRFKPFYILRQELAIVVVGDEANLLTLTLFRQFHIAVLSGDLAYLGLGQVTEGEDGAR